MGEWMKKQFVWWLCAFLSIAVSGAAQQSVTSLTLINADTDLSMTGFDPLVNGAVIDLATVPSQNMNIRANTLPNPVGSVRFALDATPNFRTESAAPYAMAGDTSGDYWAWTPSVGSHTVTATPYDAAGAGGTVGTPLSITFSVTNSAGGGVVDPPADLGSFNVTNDIFLPQFDSNHDPDDIHSIVALGCMLAHPDYAGVNYLAVHGAYGEQNDNNFIESPQLFRLVFGEENVKWVNASPQDPSWNGAVAKIKDKVKPILLAGGKAWVAEAGQSDITADWVRALIADGVPASMVRSNVVVVQHSNWNEDMTTDADLAYVKSMCAYQTINDGNGTSTARDPSAPATPAYRSTNTGYEPAARTSQNKKAQAYWKEAKWVIDDEGYFPSHSSISVGGVDFSDVVESHWIFGSPTDCNTIDKFWAKFVTNLPTPNDEPEFPTGRDYGDGGGTVTPTSGTWVEKDGILAIEMEHGELHEDWTVRPSDYLSDPTMAGSMGDGWIEWAGAQIFNTTIEDSAANGVSIYRFQISKAGDYTFRWRSKQYDSVAAGDQGNDTYVKFETGTPLAMTANNGSTQTITKYTKVWVQSQAVWSWGTNFEPLHGVFVVNPKVHYEPGIHEIRIAGRSKGHAIDRFVLYHSTASGSAAQNAPESDRVADSLVYIATNDFTLAPAADGRTTYYKDNGNNALAINAGQPANRGKFARAELTFGGTSGNYDVKITTLTEEDGECNYRLLINGVVKGTYQNPQLLAAGDMQPNLHTWSNIAMNNGDTIAVESDTDSNGLMLEGGVGPEYAWARGRWRQLELTVNGTGNGISVDAGEDQELLPSNSGTEMVGSATDDGSIDSVAWSQVSGPNTAVLTGANQTNVTVSGLIIGTYVFRLTATDDQANTAFDDVEVKVSNRVVLFEDDFSSSAYASSLNGVNWNPKWSSGTDQQNLLTGNGSYAVLDTTVAQAGYRSPCKHGFSLSEGEVAVVGSDFRYHHAAGGSITNHLNKAAFGLMLTTAPEWWSGVNKGFSLCNRGDAMGNVMVESPWTEGWQPHSSLGVDTSVGGTSDWFRVEWTIERGASNLTAQADILSSTGSLLYSATAADLGLANDTFLYAGYDTGWNDTGTNIATFSKITEVNMDDFSIELFPPNFPPVFNSDPLIGGSVVLGDSFSGSLTDHVLDPNGDVLTFSAVSVPDWLNVASNGVMTGTPGPTNVGLHVFQVTVEDPEGETDSADFQMIVLEAPPPLAPTILWSEDFEGAAPGATSGNNQTLAGTDMQTANTLGSEVVAAPGAFTSASGNVILLSTSSNNFSAIRSAVNPIDLSGFNINTGDEYRISFDLYIPSALATAVGDVQFRWSGVNETADSSLTTLSAGVHHIEYSGIFPVGAGIPTNCRPFIGFDQNGAVASDYVYFDNLNFRIGPTPASLMPNYTSWAAAMGLTGSEVNPTADLDGDGLTNLEEFMAGSGPKDGADLLAVDAVKIIEDEQMIVQWDAKPNRIYSVAQASEPGGDYAVVADDIVYPQNSHTVDVHEVSGFVKVDARLK